MSVTVEDILEAWCKSGDFVICGNRIICKNTGDQLGLLLTAKYNHDGRLKILIEWGKK